MKPIQKQLILDLLKEEEERLAPLNLGVIATMEAVRKL